MESLLALWVRTFFVTENYPVHCRTFCILAPLTLNVNRLPHHKKKEKGNSTNFQISSGTAPGVDGMWVKHSSLS